MQMPFKAYCCFKPYKHKDHTEALNCTTVSSLTFSFVLISSSVFPLPAVLLPPTRPMVGVWPFTTLYLLLSLLSTVKEWD